MIQAHRFVSFGETPHSLRLFRHPTIVIRKGRFPAHRDNHQPRHRRNTPMNAHQPNTDPARSKRTVIVAALLVALLGLTIAPGFKCTREEPDGTKTVVEFE